MFTITFAMKVLKLIAVCLLCVGGITLLVLLVQYFTNQ